VTRESTKSTSIFEYVFKGTNVVYDDIDDLFAEPDHMQDLPETKDFDRSEYEYHIFVLSSKYMIKLRNPQAAIDLNLHAPVEECPEFNVKARK